MNITAQNFYRKAAHICYFLVTALNKEDDDAVAREVATLTVDIKSKLPRDRIDFSTYVIELLEEYGSEKTKTLAEALRPIREGAEKGLEFRQRAIEHKQYTKFDYAVLHVADLFAQAFAADPLTPEYAIDASKYYFKIDEFEKVANILSLDLVTHPALSRDQKVMGVRYLMQALDKLGKNQEADTIGWRFSVATGLDFEATLKELAYKS